MERKAKIIRETNETKIELEFTLDGSGKADIKTQNGFLDHILSSFAKHGKFDLKIMAKGDIETGSHHLVEDVGICLGKAINESLGEKKGIERFSFFILPMDEAQVTVSIDLGGRAFLRFDADMPYEMIEDFESVIVKDFFEALVSNSFINLHIKKNSGINPHHIIEAIFKAFGKALSIASRLTGGNDIPSTKGMLKS
ncbi:MAG: imidazoleglycerol-phosphate dehydratase HisB [Actinomycetota bacterium]|nr:imidazoleglycerol-phosphate dehydratase HisB [Actinomycetota bacterium]